MPELLCASGLSKRYRSRNHVQDALVEVDISILEGESVALMGPSGCGKSTLLGVLGLTQRASAGSLLISGLDSDVSDRERAKWRNEYFGYLRQDYAIIPDETVLSNVKIPLDYGRRKISRKAKRDLSYEALDKVGMSWAIDRPASDLSGGEKQRVAISRALVGSPRIILADEPTAALDSTTGQEVISMLLGYRSEGAAVVLATHDPDVASRCDRVITMLDGRLEGAGH